MTDLCTVLLHGKKNSYQIPMNIKWIKIDQDVELYNRTGYLNVLPCIQGQTHQDNHVAWPLWNKEWSQSWDSTSMTRMCKLPIPSKQDQSLRILQSTKIVEWIMNKNVAKSNDTQQRLPKHNPANKWILDLECGEHSPPRVSHWWIVVSRQAQFGYLFYSDTYII